MAAPVKWREANDLSTPDKLTNAAGFTRPKHPAAIMGLGRRVRHFIAFVLVTLSSYLIFFQLLSHLTPSWPHVFALPRYKGYTSQYSFDLDKAKHPTWMASIPDSANLSSLSIPGSHDTFTSKVPLIGYQTQNFDLQDQLRAGLRYFDVRTRLANDTLRIYHGSVDTGWTYVDVILALFDFLDKHPTEAIVMRLKEEGVPFGHPTKTFEQAVLHHWWKDPVTAPGCQKHFYEWPLLARAGYNVTSYDDHGVVFEVLPTLGAMRGKIIILQEFDSVGGPWGVPWKSSHIELEDLWIIVDVEHLDDKWDAITANLQKAANNTHPGALYLTHLSASVGVLPIEAAAGPLNTTIVGMNDRTGKYLAEKSNAKAVDGKTGIVMADFEGAGLVDAILAHNEWLKK